MIDLDSLLTAISTKIAATQALSAINGKVAFGFMPEGISRPKCRIDLVSASAGNTMYGNTRLDPVRLQFSVFGNSLASADNSRKAIAVAFNGASLSLSSGTNLSCFVVSGSENLRVEAELPANPVYQALCVIEFRVEN